MTGATHDHRTSSGEQTDRGRPTDRQRAAPSGERLPSSTASHFGARYGHDFSAVRVHSDARAGTDARNLDAQAFTVGSDIHFAPGRYEPNTADGQRLIAHELAHVVQQGGKSPSGTAPDRSGEHAADEASGRALSGGSVSIAPKAATGPQLQEVGTSPPSAQPALSPDELWRLAQDLRGFESSPSGKGDDLRSKPATAPPGAFNLDPSGNPVAKGAPLGKGYETVAAVQLLDAEGRQIDVARGMFHSGGPEKHAERIALRALEAHTPATVAGGRLVVVGDQTICPTCRAALLKFAEERHLTIIEPYEPTRARLKGPGNVSPKTASRSSTQGRMPQLALEKVPPIAVAAPTGPGPTTGGGTAPRGGTPPAPKIAPQPKEALEPGSKLPAEPATTAAGKKPPPVASPHETPVPRASPTTAKAAPTSGSFTKGTVTIHYDTASRTSAKPGGLTEVDTSRLSADKGVHLSRSRTGAALVHTFSAAQMGRSLLDLAAMATDADTTKKIHWVTHPLQSYLRSQISDAEEEFLTSHPDPTTLASSIDAAALREIYEVAWSRLSVHQGRRILTEIALMLTPEDERGPAWYEAAKSLGTVSVPPQDLAAFRSSAEAYESRMIDTLQDVARYRATLPQLAAELGQRAGVLSQIATDLEDVWLWIVVKIPFAFYVMPNLYFESQFVAELAAKMGTFASAVRARDRAYQRLDDEFDAQLRQVGRHIDNPGIAVNQSMARRRLRRQ